MSRAAETQSETTTTARRTAIAICLFLIAITWAVFGQTVGHDFVNYDDSIYVYKNPNVFHGLTLSGVKWAATHFDNDNWHPLTSISHMVDCQIFGLKAGGHHFTNVLLHSITGVLVFLVLYQMTNAVWRSAFVATIFAIHPLHVESVAWIAERKDVLSALFFMLTLGAYTRYARIPTTGRYFTMSIFFVLGLMSKPMLVTLPGVLFLMDYWPLQRWHSVPLRKLTLEKVPLLAISAAASIATVIAQTRAEARLAVLPFAWRLGNAFAACLIYLRQMIWPSNLALIYPHPGKLPLWQTVSAAVVMASLTVGALVFRKKGPYLITGWSWYLIMLLPVIGLIQVGGQGHADRYTYLPQIGLYLAITWGISDLSTYLPFRRQILGGAAGLIIAAFAWCAWIQTSYWRDSEKLYNHTLAVTGRNDLARLTLGEFFLERQRFDKAIPEFRAVLANHPKDPDANLNLADALVQKREFKSAIGFYRSALANGSNPSTTHYKLGMALLQDGQAEEAIAEFQAALSARQSNSEAETELATLLLEQGRGEEAVQHYRNVLKLHPQSPAAHYNLAVGLHRQNHLHEAIVHYREALAIQPDYPDATYFLHQALRQSERGDESSNER